MTIDERHGRGGLDSAAEGGFPGLHELGLGPDDLRALASQGFLNAESRGGREYWKLRFRRDGRQVVRYVGAADRAARVRLELETLQRRHRHSRQFARLVRYAKRAFRAHRTEVAPLLEQAGYRFHGRAVRRIGPAGMPHPPSPSPGTIDAAGRC